jgi:hypothetical protein
MKRAPEFVTTDEDYRGWKFGWFTGPYFTNRTGPRNATIPYLMGN